MIAEDRPPSLLQPRPIGSSTLLLGLIATITAHVGIPLAVLGSQWLLVLLGLAIPPLERDRPKQITEIVAAEFVKLGKPFDPRKLPQRKVPPVIKRKVEGIAYTPDAKEQPKKEEKEKPREFKESALDNLIDRTKEFAEDVPEREEEGDPNGLREGTATTAREGDIYQGQLVLFFRRNFTVNNMVADPDKLAAFAGVEVSDDGHLLDVRIVRSSGDPAFDNDVIASVRALMESGASIPEPPPALSGNYYGKTISVRFSGKDLR